MTKPPSLAFFFFGTSRIRCFWLGTICLAMMVCFLTQEDYFGASLSAIGYILGWGKGLECVEP